MEEIWMDIENHEEDYQISSTGKVKNKKTNKILIGDINNIGYKRIVLYRPEKERVFIHRLVAKHFCDGYKDNLVVNHKDGNKLNNNYENLEWVTRSENDLHAFRLDLRKPNPTQFKHKIEMYDIKTDQTIKIYENVQVCCDDNHVSRSNIYNCCNGKQNTCKGYGFRYYN